MTVKKFTWTEGVVKKEDGERWNYATGKIRSAVLKKNEKEINSAKN